MGRGLAAILLDAEHDGRAAPARPRSAPAPGRADRAQPAPAAARLRRGGAARARRLAGRARRAPARARAPVAGRHLRADRRRAPLARRAARRARHRSRRSCASHDDAESLELALIENMAREDLNPVEEARACALLVEELGLTREEIGRRVGRSRVAVSNLLRLLDLPDEALDLLAARRPHRGPRPRDPDGRPTTTTAAGSPAPRSPRAGTSAAPRPRRARCREAARDDGPVRAAPRRGATPTRRRPRRASARRSAARWAPTSRSRRAGTGYKVALTFESLDEALELAVADRHRRARLIGRYHRPRPGD